MSKIINSLFAGVLTEQIASRTLVDEDPRFAKFTEKEAELAAGTVYTDVFVAAAKAEVPKIPVVAIVIP